MGTSWVWESLALGKLGFIDVAELRDFDWNAQHQTYGTPLIAILLGKLCKKGDSDSDSDSADEDNILIDFVTNNQAQKQARLDLLKLAVQRGADPNVKAPQSFSCTRQWWKIGAADIQESKTRTITFRDFSAFSVVVKCVETFELMESVHDWKAECEFLESAMRILNSYSGAGVDSAPPMNVAEGVVHTWECVLRDQESTDLTIVCRAPGANEGHAAVASAAPELRAHRLVLRNSSKVLRAMLTSSFREGGTNSRLEVLFDRSAVHLLLELVYTGSSDGPDDDSGVLDTHGADTMAATLELAHQWQIGHVVQMLTRALARELSADTFATICELGLRLQLPELVSASRAFARNADTVRADFNAGSRYPPAVQAMLAELFNTASGIQESQRKRRRRSF
mmetsp:Transcript_57311/g.114836  ORF Transcript_57311/g.114836 Transcript_57311/m.114836 type:complete len:396 (-) Transcript_57311:61-1248(-)